MLLENLATHQRKSKNLINLERKINSLSKDINLLSHKEQIELLSKLISIMTKGVNK